MRKKLRTRMALCFAFCFAMLLPCKAFAYIDPSTTTFAIQAIASIAVVVGGVAVVFWRKVKKKAKDKLGIEGSIKKETEADIVINEMAETENETQSFQG